jgi:hypothetical protein
VFEDPLHHKLDVHPLPPAAGGQFGRADMMRDTMAVQGGLPCCGGLRVADPDPHSFELLDPRGSGRAKMTHKNRKKVEKFNVLCIAGYSLLRDEGFSCSLGILYNRGLGISKLQFMIKKLKKC